MCSALLNGKERHLVNGALGLACLEPRQSAQTTMVFMDLVRALCPKVHKGLEAISVEAQDFSPWFQTIFRQLPLKTRLRVFDVYANEGISALFRVGLALLNINKSVLKWAESRDGFLTHMRQYLDDLCDPGMLMKEAFAFKKTKMARIVRRTEAALASVEFMPFVSKHMLFRPHLDAAPSSVVGDDMRVWDIIYSFLPNRHTLCDPFRTFSSLDQGTSWKLFLRFFRGVDTPMLMLLRTLQGHSIGCWFVKGIAAKASYSNDPEASVFYLGPGDYHGYRWIEGATGTAVILEEKQGILIGVDECGNAALEVDRSLETGSSATSSVFRNNALLKESGRFEISSLELFLLK